MDILRQIPTVIHITLGFMRLTGAYWPAIRAFHSNQSHGESLVNHHAAFRPAVLGRAAAFLLAALGSAATFFLAALGSVAVFLVAVPGPAMASPVAVTAGDNQWPLDARHLDAQRAWQLSTGSHVVVAVIDTGVDAGSRDLAGRVLPGVDLTGESADGRVDTSADSHGTSVAAVIAGTGASGGPGRMVGLAPGAMILPVRVAASNSQVDLAILAQGISYAATHGAQVINLSLATPVDNPEIRGAIDYALGHDIVVVAAAGNEGETGNPTVYPAAVPGVVAVAGTTESDQVWAQGGSGAAIALAAPAEHIYSADDRGGHLTADGTSYSAPYVAAGAALLRARYPIETGGQIVARLIGSARQLDGSATRSPRDGYGLVDPYKALTAPAPVSTANPLLTAPAPPPAAGVSTVALAGTGGAAVTLALALIWWWLKGRRQGLFVKAVETAASRARKR
jgi:type VII secretion-associated serine protease mycosin